MQQLYIKYIYYKWGLLDTVLAQKWVTCLCGSSGAVHGMEPMLINQKELLKYESVNSRFHTFVMERWLRNSKLSPKFYSHL